MQAVYFCVPGTGYTCVLGTGYYHVPGTGYSCVLGTGYYCVPGTGYSCVLGTGYYCVPGTGYTCVVQGTLEYQVQGTICSRKKQSRLSSRQPGKWREILTENSTNCPDLQTCSTQISTCQKINSFRFTIYLEFNGGGKDCPAKTCKPIIFISPHSPVCAPKHALKLLNDPAGFDFTQKLVLNEEKPSWAT